MTISADNIVEFIGCGLFFLCALVDTGLCAWMFRRAQKELDTEMSYIAQRSIPVLVLQAWMVQSYALLALDALVFERPGDGVEIEWIRLALYVVAQRLLLQILCSILRVHRHVRRVAMQIGLYIYFLLALASWSSSASVRLTAVVVGVVSSGISWIFFYRWSWWVSERTTAIGAVMVLLPLGYIAHCAIWLLSSFNWPLLPKVASSTLYFLVDILLYGVVPFVVVVSRWRNTCRENETEDNKIWSSARNPGHTQSPNVFRRVISWRDADVQRFAQQQTEE